MSKRPWKRLSRSGGLIQLPLTRSVSDGYSLMFRKTIAVFFVLFCAILSGFHVLEDLDLPRGIEIQSSTPLPLPDLGHTGRVPNTIIESAEHFRGRQSYGFSAAVKRSFGQLRFSLTIYKLHRVFLI